MQTYSGNIKNFNLTNYMNFNIPFGMKQLLRCDSRYPKSLEL